MKVKDNGFTLIELLVMMTVLGILMAITVPNMSGILSNQKENVIAEDVGKMVDTVKIKMSNKETIKPLYQEGECYKFTLEDLNDSDDFKKGPNNEKYDFSNSFVIVKRESNQYKYYVTLIEGSGNKAYGVNSIDFNTFSKDPHQYIGAIEGVSDSSGCSQINPHKNY